MNSNLAWVNFVCQSGCTKDNTIADVFTFMMLDIFMYYTCSTIFILLSCRVSDIKVYLQVEWKIVWIMISWLLRSQLIWIYTVFEMGYIQFIMLRVKQECTVVSFTAKVFGYIFYSSIMKIHLQKVMKSEE